ncbi:hypothetical protein OUZ56_017296 [Daphnia magna]|uniref:Uncharacterized protein n=1 Tax=Daphnia magna TaxID=35525 RepID=A0ABR0ASL5_9CRUS|nr:hypothetical protein OUZ56_017296 [Daphnia magna]
MTNVYLNPATQGVQYYYDPILKFHGEGEKNDESETTVAFRKPTTNWGGEERRGEEKRALGGERKKRTVERGKLSR